MGVPEHLLERAAKELALEKPFMPRASDLIDRTKTLLKGAEQKGDKRANLDEMNARLDKDGHRHIRWIREGDHLKLVPADHRPWDESKRCTPADARRILKEEGANAPFLKEILGAIERASPPS